MYINCVLLFNKTGVEGRVLSKRAIMAHDFTHHHRNLDLQF